MASLLTLPFKFRIFVEKIWNQKHEMYKYKDIKI